jgi:hypothetical protein
VEKAKLKRRCAGGRKGATMSCRRGWHIYPMATQYGEMRMVGQHGLDADRVQHFDSSSQSIYMQSICGWAGKEIAALRCASHVWSKPKPRHCQVGEVVARSLSLVSPAVCAASRSVASETSL